MIVFNGLSFADEEGPVCHRCEKIREYNAQHPENNYYWYDDYLKKENKKPADTNAKEEAQKEPSSKNDKSK